MQQKLKSVFRRSSRSRRTSDQYEQTGDVTGHVQTSPSSGDHRRVSSDRRGDNSIDSSATGSVFTGRSRPASSVHDDTQNHASAKQRLSNDFDTPPEPIGGAIANDYKAYLPALSPVNDDYGDEYITLGNGGKTEHSGGSAARYEEPAVDRNVALQSSSAADTKINQQHSQAQSVIEDTNHGKHSVAPKSHKLQQEQSGVRHATIDGTAHGEETALAKELRESGVADLRNTVDTEGVVKWAPAVTHEIIKPHTHEIIQQKIYREIHNYEHFYRLQPVRMTEVLPPRHWIPNPDGEGLIEISADELPARTGENRWWSICEHSSPYSLQTSIPKYRTEPEIIDAGTYITKEGYERKETIIRHPPTLADLTGYGGPVQAMHFDHKTGKSWMGELTTMDKLQQLQQELDRAPDSHAFKMTELNKSLPSLPPASADRSLNSVPARKPVQRHASLVNGSPAVHST